MRTHHRAWLVTVGLAVLVGGSLITPTAAGAAPAGPDLPVAAVGRAEGHSVRVADVAKLPRRPAVAGARSGPAVAASNARPTLPSRPTVGRHSMAAAAPAATPNAVASVAANFDAATGMNCSHCQQPSDVNAAVGRFQIAEATNVNVDVYDRTGAQACHFAYSDLLGTPDNLTDPRIVYDNVRHRFVTVVTVVPAAGTDPDAIWVAVTTSESPCGTWFMIRMTMNDNSLTPVGHILDYPFLALDRNAILLSANVDSGVVWSIPKNTIYNGQGFSVPIFSAVFNTVPVTASGTPMRAAPTYFLASVPGTGYTLYQMTDSGSPDTTELNQVATISKPFDAPSRRANQPGTDVTLDPQGGQIEWSPVLDSTNLIWFTHGIDDGGFPAIRYGTVNVTNDSAQIAIAFHSGTSDDFNPSIGVGESSSGARTVFLNWAYTDAPNGVATSATVNSFVAGDSGSLPMNLIGTDTVLVNGSSTGQTRFGDLSSVTIDPAVSAGTCAVTAQQYFGVDWNTRIARVGNC